MPVYKYSLHNYLSLHNPETVWHLPGVSNVQRTSANIEFELSKRCLKHAPSISSNYGMLNKQESLELGVNAMECFYVTRSKTYSKIIRGTVITQIC